jgi:hypothetical protein
VHPIELDRVSQDKVPLVIAVERRSCRQDQVSNTARGQRYGAIDAPSSRQRTADARLPVLARLQEFLERGMIL